jgi:Galactose oxidase, central domain
LAIRNRPKSVFKPEFAGLCCWVRRLKLAAVLGGIPAVQNLHEQPPDPSYAELYDPVLHTFSPVAGLTLPQTDYTATLLNGGMVLIAGGANFTGKPIADAWLIDPSSDVLSATGRLGYARVGHTATLLRDGRVLVTGRTDSNGKALAGAELYH